MSFNVNFSSDGTFDVRFSALYLEAGGTNDYTELINLPKLNGVTIEGDNTADYYNFGTVYDKDTGTAEGTIPIIGVGGKLDSSIIPNNNVQSDWSQSTITADDYIKNKPTNLSQFTDNLGTSPVHTHSQYLTTETDPIFSASVAAGITSTNITTWNNKSNFSGSYTDLTNKPTIPTALADLTGVLALAKGGTGATTARDAQANLQIYTALTKLNLPTPCSTHDIINALPDYSIFSFAVNNNTVITDIPSDWGQLTIIKSAFRKTILYNTSLTTGSNGNNFWFGEHRATAVTWSKIFTSNINCAVPIANGGTGATTAATALTALGAASSVNVGDVSTLSTTNKTVVGAINELYNMITGS